MQFFFNTFFEFGFLDFCLDLIEFFKCMTWQSIFLFFLFFFFFRSHDSSTSGNDACHRWLFRLKHHSLCENFFENGSSFGSRVVHIIYAQRKRYGSKDFHLCQQGKGLWFKRLLIPFLLVKKGYGSKGSRKMGNFRSTCPKASIKVILEYHDFETCIFGHWKGLTGLKL